MVIKAAREIISATSTLIGYSITSIGVLALGIGISTELTNHQFPLIELGMILIALSIFVWGIVDFIHILYIYPEYNEADTIPVKMGKIRVNVK
ncbi:MAG: hypothetical protein M1481_01660 [Candidatus Thermoplasmatota archaeon]|nr:hypothetical protein [Candidatus Thermoplasmatota archaeon]MCL5963137.1 hypothetical protein [Candidatus Thermoplasmatota archaeon]